MPLTSPSSAAASSSSASARRSGPGRYLFQSAGYSIAAAALVQLLFGVALSLQDDSCADLRPDVVITYVNSTRPLWQQSFEQTVASMNHGVFDASKSRFRETDQLRYLVRSLDKFFPTRGHVFLVLSEEDQVPDWLDTSHKGVTIVYHREIFRDVAHLPTFNSEAIEVNLHRIKGLSEHYVYFNDDMLLGGPVTASTFFSCKSTPNKIWVYMDPPGFGRAPPRASCYMDGRNDKLPIRFSSLAHSNLLLERAFRPDRQLEPCEDGDEPQPGRRPPLHAPYPFILSSLAVLQDHPVFKPAYDAMSGQQFRMREGINNLYTWQQACLLSGGGIEVSWVWEALHTLFLPLGDLLFPVKYLLFHARLYNPVFISLNDNMSDDSADQVLAILHPYLRAMFPYPSQYELPGQ